MRLTLRALLFIRMPVFLLIFSLSPTTDAFAATDPCEIGPTSCERPANSRFFQMALFTDENNVGATWEDTLADTDILWFGEGNPLIGQPPTGRHIMQFRSWSNDHTDPPVLAGTESYDWSRILAVVIDEPYTTFLGDNPENPCWNSDRQLHLTILRGKLLYAAATLHAIAPRTRLWVNFHQLEVDWMRDSVCPQDLNDPTIDVVSLDNYNVPLWSLTDEYDWFISTIPEQQIALVPGTFYENDWSFTTKVLAQINLRWYFDYADRMNQQCDMGLGRVGRTGNYDGCRVWIVAGWFAGETYLDYLGLFHPSTVALRNVWRDQLAKIRRFGPRALPQGELQLLELLE